MEKPYVFRFKRRKYGSQIYTRAFVQTGPEQWESLGDPYRPCVTPKVSELNAAADSVFARLAAGKEIESRTLVEQIARMIHESETGGGFTRLHSTWRLGHDLVGTELCPRSDEEIETESRTLVEQIAHMIHESETGGGFTREDACTTLNSLISQARVITGINPGHPHLYCMECQVPRDECSCDEPEDETHA